MSRLQAINFPREWEFFRSYQNGEDVLFNRALSYPDMLLPYSVPDVVSKLLRDYPDSEYNELTGTLYTIMRNLWYDAYREKPDKTPEAPPEN